MSLRKEKDLNRIKKTLALYNMFPNLIWSILNITPISIYCYNFLDYQKFFIFLAVSLIPIGLKKSVIDKFQISRTVKIYKLLRVHQINRIAQNGVIINNLIKRKFPEHKIVTSKHSSIIGLINQTYIFEKFHLILFSFFSLTNVNALMKGYLIWAFIILLSNVAYNIYPNLLQQYIRLKLILFDKRNNQKSTPAQSHV